MTGRTSTRPTTGPIHRAGPNDLLQLTYGSRPAETQVGAVLVIETTSPLDLAEVRAAMADRIPATPRLRQRLTKTPLGCGRPVWVDDPAFDIARHVTRVTCPHPGDERALLDLAADAVGTRLPADRPLWAATLVQGLAGGRTGLILTFHHVLADGIGGLAVLGHLVDGAPRPPRTTFPGRPPTPRALAVDAAATRLQAFARLPATVRRVGAALAQLRPGLSRAAPRWPMNRPAGPHRRLGVARAELAAVRSAAHARGGTVNDVVLAAVAGALRTFLLDRGTPTPDELVVGVPVSARAPGEDIAVGNDSGVVSVRIPATGDAATRLSAVVQATSAAKSGPRGASAALLQPFFRLLAALGVVQGYLSRQRRLNTFVTNLRGPPERLAFLGATVRDILVINLVAGNAAVAFGVLSYAGTLAVTVVADRDVCPDVAALAAELEAGLNDLVAQQLGAAP